MWHYPEKSHNFSNIEPFIIPDLSLD
jgi:hypothetical protein